MYTTRMYQHHSSAQMYGQLLSSLSPGAEFLLPYMQPNWKSRSKKEAHSISTLISKESRNDYETRLKFPKKTVVVSEMLTWRLSIWTSYLHTRAHRVVHLRLPLPLRGRIVARLRNLAKSRMGHRLGMRRFSSKVLLMNWKSASVGLVDGDLLGWQLHNIILFYSRLHGLKLVLYITYVTVLMID